MGIHPGKRSLLIATLFAGLLVTTPAIAIPTLQLDILGGEYDDATETIVTDKSTFTVLALANPGNISASEILSRNYYLSVALTPKTENPDLNGGLFRINGNQVRVTADMEYGTPPADIETDKSLPGHGIFETYFYELGFNFDSNSRVAPYNSQDNPGGATASSGGTMYAYAFEIDRTLLNPAYNLHFDLYDIIYREAKKKKTGYYTIDNFAPFSHDAGTEPTPNPPPPVPEPTTLLLLGSGIAAFAIRRRKS